MTLVETPEKKTPWMDGYVRIRGRKYRASPYAWMAAGWEFAFAIRPGASWNSRALCIGLGLFLLWDKRIS